jgi:2-furoyl-CoA dehydrogenase FAD binding subunit
MKPRAFEYVRPDTLREAIQALREFNADAKVMAGGQSLMAMMNLRLVEPKALIDISRVPELRHINVEDDKLQIGAAVTQAELLSWRGLADKAPFISKALPWVGHFQTRNRGTVCGSIAHADPSSELPLSLALLDGEVILNSRSGARKLKAAEFQTGMLQTARRDDEIISAVHFPVGVGRKGSAFREVARRHGDFAIVAVGAVVLEDGTTRLGVGGVAEKPAVIDLPASMTADQLTERIENLAWELGGSDDIHASARYRRDLLRRLAPQVIKEAQECAA